MRRRIQSVKVWSVLVGTESEHESERMRLAVYAPTRLFAQWNALDVARAVFPACAASVKLYSVRPLRKGEAIPEADFAIPSYVARLVAHRS